VKSNKSSDTFKFQACRHATVIRKLLTALAPVGGVPKNAKAILVGIDQDWDKRATVDAETLKWLEAQRENLHRRYREAKKTLAVPHYCRPRHNRNILDLGTFLDGLKAVSEGFHGTLAHFSRDQYADIIEELWLWGYEVDINGYEKHVVQKPF
jgi:hypothetical protein